MKRIRLVIMAKAPQAGLVKTRLIPALGAGGAAALANRLLHCAIEHALGACAVLARAEDTEQYSQEVAVKHCLELCVTPEPSNPAWDIFRQHYQLHWSWQGEGDLGDRLARVCKRVIEQDEAIIVMGSDCPELTAERIQQAAEALQQSNAVIIPAVDGGYTLLGLSQFQASIFTGIQWSTASVLLDTVQRIHELGWQLTTLPSLHDIDEPADLQWLPAQTRGEDMYDLVQDYYGKQLQESADLKTSACCDISSVPEWLKPLLAKIHPEVLARYYGCGLVCPPLLQGCRVLDLGCGTGRDVYALAQLVGPSGLVVGVDMTVEQLAIAQQHQAYHSAAFGYDNVRFIHGYIEKLDELGLAPGSFDVIVSNCVVNLSPDKAAVLAGVKRLLKPGGEFYFADVYADRRVPESVKNDPVLYGECLGGALYWNDFLRLAKHSGFIDSRLVTDRPLTITDPQLAAKIGKIKFYSATFRLFNIAALEDACEDHGQAVIYQGTIPELPAQFTLDGHHAIETGRVFPVCGNTFRMLQETRFAPHFNFIGDFSRHFGLFAGCGATIPFAEDAQGQMTAVCC